MTSLLRTPVLLALVVTVGVSASAVNVTTGSGSSVTSVDRSANFDSIVNGTDLTTYTEGALSVTTSGVGYVTYDPFNGAGNGSAFHYASGGNSDWVTIKTTDSLPVSALEFLYGNGWSVSGLPRPYGLDTATIDWEAYSGINLIGSGSLVLPVGTVLGFNDAGGFDSLRVRSVRTPGDTYQALALDDLKVQLGGGRVPDSGSGLGLCFVAACAGLRLLRRRS